MYLSEGTTYVAESKSDFDGFEILLIENWKPGVKRVHMRKIYPNQSASFYMVFANEKLTEDLVVRIEEQPGPKGNNVVRKDWSLREQN